MMDDDTRRNPVMVGSWSSPTWIFDFEYRSEYQKVYLAHQRISNPRGPFYFPKDIRTFLVLNSNNYVIG